MSGALYNQAESETLNAYLQSIGDYQSLSRERVRQVKVKALSRIRNSGVGKRLSEHAE